MKEKIKNLSNKKIVVTTLCAFAIVLLLGFTYAYWSRTFSQTGENISTYDCFDIAFSENTDGIAMENGYPISDEEGLKTEAYEVTIRNTCKTAAGYNVILNKLNTSTLDNSHVKIAVNNNIKLLSETETATTTLTNANDARIISSGVLAESQTRTIKLQNWMDANTNESEGANKTFSYKITIEAVAGNKQLKNLILINNKVKDVTPSFELPEPTNEESDFFTSTGSGLYKAEDEEGDSYYFRGNIENNYVSFGTYKENLTVYTVFNNNSSYRMLVFDEYEKAVSICNSNYKNAKYESAESCVNDIKTKEFQAGDSIIWRIVRINGDGTIRIVSNDSVGTSAFNAYETYDKKYAGYTYDNDHICTKENPCDSQTGISSTVKNFLENWYQENLTNQDSKIATTTFCNDTSFYKSEYGFDFYGARGRADQSKPSLICPDTTESFGGNYKLKIGLLTVDEVTFAGLITNQDAIKNKNYLDKNIRAINTLSPMVDRKSDWWLYSIYHSKISSSSNTKANSFNSINPVINLKSDIKVINGDGSKNNPYVIE